MHQSHMGDARCPSIWNGTPCQQNKYHQTTTRPVCTSMTSLLLLGYAGFSISKGQSSPIHLQPAKFIQEWYISECLGWQPWTAKMSNYGPKSCSNEWWFILQPTRSSSMGNQRVWGHTPHQRNGVDTWLARRPKCLLEWVVWTLGYYIFFIKIHQKHDIHNGQEVTVACNGLAVLWQAPCSILPDPSSSCYNQIGAILHLRWNLSIQLEFEHMQGHQNSGEITTLSHMAWMNIDCDLNAKSCTVTFHLDLSDTQYHLMDGAVIYKTNESPNQSRAIYGLISKGWPSSTIGRRKTNLVVGQAQWLTGNSQPRPWVVCIWHYNYGSPKQQHDLYHMAKTWNGGSSICKTHALNAANKQVKDKDHIFKYKDLAAQHQWDQALQMLETLMKDWKTFPPILQQVIMEELWKWRDDTTTITEQLDPQSAAYEQTLLGWHLMFEGVATHCWQMDQEATWKAYRSENWVNKGW